MERNYRVSINIFTTRAAYYEFCKKLGNPPVFIGEERLSAIDRRGAGVFLVLIDFSKLQLLRVLSGSSMPRLLGEQLNGVARDIRKSIHRSRNLGAHQVIESELWDFMCHCLWWKFPESMAANRMYAPENVLLVRPHQRGDTIFYHSAPPRETCSVDNPYDFRAYTLAIKYKLSGEGDTTAG